MRPLLNALAEQKALGGRVHCLGQRNDVRAWMARSELLLLPTRYEGMPNVVLEAMAEGLTVVTTRVEGIVELLGDQLEKQSVHKEAWNDFLSSLQSLRIRQSNKKRSAKRIANVPKRSST